MSSETRDLQVQEVEKQEVMESGAERTRDQIAFVPRADIYETNDTIVVVADMPGVDEHSLDITLENDVLTINGYVEPAALDNYRLAYAEYRVGDYHRENIEATVRDGVLRLHLPKAAPTTRKIAVKAG
jgi:HSP20 family protein